MTAMSLTFHNPFWGGPNAIWSDTTSGNSPAAYWFENSLAFVSDGEQRPILAFACPH